MVIPKVNGKRNVYTNIVTGNVKKNTDSSHIIASTSTTVHAQRKFAQGVVLNNFITMSSVEIPPKSYKEKEKNKFNSDTENASVRRPKPEDFLRYICFRNMGLEKISPALSFLAKPVQEEEDMQDTSAVLCTEKTTSSSIKSPEQSVRQKKLKKIKVAGKQVMKVKVVKKDVARLSKLITKSKLNKKKLIRNKIHLKGKISKFTFRKAHIKSRIIVNSLRHGLRSGGELPAGSEIGLLLHRKQRILKKKRKINCNIVKKSEMERKLKQDQEKKGKAAKNSSEFSKKKNQENRLTRLTRASFSMYDNKSTTSRLTRKTKEMAKVAMSLEKDDAEDEDDSDEDELVSYVETPVKGCRKSTRLDIEYSNEIKKNLEGKDQRQIKKKSLKQDVETETTVNKPPSNLGKTKSEKNKKYKKKEGKGEVYKRLTRSSTYVVKSSKGEQGASKDKLREKQESSDYKDEDFLDSDSSLETKPNVLKKTKRYLPVRGSRLQSSIAMEENLKATEQRLDSKELITNEINSKLKLNIFDKKEKNKAVITETVERKRGRPPLKDNSSHDKKIQPGSNLKNELSSNKDVDKDKKEKSHKSKEVNLSENMINKIQTRRSSILFEEKVDQLKVKVESKSTDEIKEKLKLPDNAEKNKEEEKIKLVDKHSTNKTSDNQTQHKQYESATKMNSSEEEKEKNFKTTVKKRMRNRKNTTDEPIIPKRSTRTRNLTYTSGDYYFAFESDYSDESNSSFNSLKKPVKKKSRRKSTANEKEVQAKKSSTNENKFLNEVTDFEQNELKINKRISIEQHDEEKYEQIKLKGELVDTKPQTSSESAGISDSKPKPSMSDTWREAFKNVKIPKTNQSTLVSHGVKPFVRKSYPDTSFSQKTSLRIESKVLNSYDSTSESDNLVASKFPCNKPFNTDEQNKKIKSISVGVSSSINTLGKTDLQTEKSFTQLQYENRSTQLVNSLHDSNTLSKSVTLSFSKHKNSEKSNNEIEKIESSGVKTSSEGKHMNLPMAVEHTLRRMSPMSCRKPIPVKKIGVKKEEFPTSSTDSNRTGQQSLSEIKISNSANIDIMTRKKINMTAEEISKWMNDSTSSGIEHAKDCGIFERNQCECSFRTSSTSMMNSGIGVGFVVPVDSEKSERKVVEPPVPLKEIVLKYSGEKISSYKVEEFKEKMYCNPNPGPSKSVSSSSPQDICKKEIPSSPVSKKPKTSFVSKSLQDKAWKSTRSMTDDEMCEFDFKFERNSFLRDSSPEIDDPASSNEEMSEKPEKKSIFHQKPSKRPSLSKSPCAFSAENESSVYAFEPDLPPASKPFRRSGSAPRGKDLEDDIKSSSSIAVQVNMENVLSCSSAKPEQNVRTFYIPLPGDAPTSPDQIQGVAVKLEGPEKNIVVRAELVTKPLSGFVRPPAAVRTQLVSLPTQRKPEQKVRPLPSCSTQVDFSCNTPPVGTVQPNVRNARHLIELQDSQNSEELVSESVDYLASQSSLSSPVMKSNKSGKNKTGNKEKSSGFPKMGSYPRVTDAPTFYPTEHEFEDPMEYIEKITPLAREFGICKIVPPTTFKPECKISDDMRFTAYNHYVHKMLHRWGPNVKEMMAIKKYLKTQSISLKQPPWIGGVEVDLPRLYQIVQQCGGLKEVIEKKRWTKVADLMKIPKAAQERVTKLDDIYCKFLLPYDTLSQVERSKLLEETETEWREKERKALSGNSNDFEDDEDEDEDDAENDRRFLECISKGRSMPLSQFFRIARNTMAMYFPNRTDSPSPAEVENEFWRYVMTGTYHVCVNSGSIDSGTYGYGFPTSKQSQTSRHPWNLKVLTNHSGSILRSIGPLMGVTVPTLHLGMLYSSGCWYRDPHALPWIEYLHTGACKIWYGVPDEWSNALKGAIKKLFPRHYRDRPVWLSSDMAMVPPDIMVDNGVALCKIVQEPGQFILVFPKAFTSTICTGYVVSESVYFAKPIWLETAEQVFKDIRLSSEPTMFSLEKLVVSIATDPRTSFEVLTQILCMMKTFRDREVAERKELAKLGLEVGERLPKTVGIVRRGPKSSHSSQEEQYECDTCRATLFFSLVTNSNDEVNYCLSHAIDIFNKDMSILKYCKLLYTYDEEEIEEMIEKIKSKIEEKLSKSQKKSHFKNVTNS